MPASAELSSDTTRPALTPIIITQHYCRLAFAEILMIDTSFSYDASESVCYAKSYSANTVDC